MCTLFLFWESQYGGELGQLEEGGCLSHLSRGEAPLQWLVSGRKLNVVGRKNEFLCWEIQKFNMMT